MRGELSEVEKKDGGRGREEGRDGGSEDRERGSGRGREERYEEIGFEKVGVTEDESIWLTEK